MTRSSPVIDLNEATTLLENGGVLSYPTETFYALGVDPRNEDAVSKLLSIKGRDGNQGVSLIVDSAERVCEWLSEDGDGLRIRREAVLQQFWPGPLTIVIALNEQVKEKFSAQIFGPRETLAVRLAPTRLGTELARSVGGGITATSANPKGQSPAASEEQVHGYFPTIPVVRDRIGGASSGKHFDRPSTILDVSRLPFTILREGAISARELAPWL